MTGLPLARRNCRTERVSAADLTTNGRRDPRRTVQGVSDLDLEDVLGGGRERSIRGERAAIDLADRPDAAAEGGRSARRAPEDVAVVVVVRLPRDLDVVRAVHRARLHVHHGHDRPRGRQHAGIAAARATRLHRHRDDALLLLRRRARPPERDADGDHGRAERRERFGRNLDRGLVAVELVERHAVRGRSAPSPALPSRRRRCRPPRSPRRRPPRWMRRSGSMAVCGSWPAPRLLRARRPWRGLRRRCRSGRSGSGSRAARRGGAAGPSVAHGQVSLASSSRPRWPQQLIRVL